MNAKQVSLKIKKFFLLVLCFGLVGCAVFDSNYYIRSNSPGYITPHFKGMCGSCNKTFLLSAQQWVNKDFIKCPYCGFDENAEMVRERYLPIENERQRQSDYTIAGFLSSLSKSLQTQQKSYQIQRQAQNQHGFSNPYQDYYVSNQRSQIAPNGSYVGGKPQLAPDGTYVGGRPHLAPDGTWVGGEPHLAPDGKWVGGQPHLAPDGTWVGGEPYLSPDGTWVGVQDN